MSAKGEITTCTTCPYCGVGCGVLASIDAAQNVSVKGDPDHPANFGKLCSKGSSLAETLGLKDRLLYPQIRGKRATWDTALTEIADKFKTVIEEHGPDAVAFYVSGQLLTEGYYIANKLMKGYFGSANIDTNSRLCMASTVVGHKRAFGADTVPGNYEDLELADQIILVGSNLAWAHPILYQRILKAKEARPDMRIVNIDPRKTASSDQAAQHLMLKPGADVTLFEGLFKYLDENGYADPDFIASQTEGYAAVKEKSSAATLDSVSAATGLSKEALTEFYAQFAETEKTVTIFSQGVNQAQDGTDKVNAIINCHLLTGRIAKPGLGPFSVTGQPNAMGGREVGGLANQLASHLDINKKDHRDLVQRFWDSPSMTPKAGLKAVDMFEAVHSGKIKAIWVMATNPVVSMPNANRVKEALEKCELVIVSDIYENTDTGNCAHILLPSTGWGEKDGTVTNSERRISRQKAFLPAPGETQHDWWQFCEVANRMGYDGFDFKGPHEIFDEYARLCTFENNGTRDLDLSGLIGMDKDSYDSLTPIQWPVNKDYPKGRARLFDDGHYFTDSGKAKFITPAPSEDISPAAGELTLNTGRIRDQWHTMTRTGRAARLSSHLAEPFVKVHPADAEAAGIATAEIAHITSGYGQALARVIVTPRQQKGSLFMPMHFTAAVSSLGRADAVTAPVTDPKSGQPALKSTHVKLSAFAPDWYGFLILSDETSFDAIKAVSPYWAKAHIDEGVRYELAGHGTSETVMTALKLKFPEKDGFNILNMSGQIGAIERMAVFDADNQLIAALYLGSNPVALSRDWISTQLGEVQDVRQRFRILAGRPGADMPDLSLIHISEPTRPY